MKNQVMRHATAAGNVPRTRQVPAKKSLLLLLVIGIVAGAAHAQPQKFSYQAVVRTAAGAPVPNQAISLRFSVLDLTRTGTVQYLETQAATTNAFGLVNVLVGTGTVVSGSFAAITWGTAKFLKVEADINGGTNYATLGTNELTSVPFALYAPPPTTGGAIIPFASGTTISLISSVVGLLGFGISTSAIITINGINLAGNSSTYAFTAPRAGTITSISGFFSTTNAATFPVAATVTAQLYRSSAATPNLFLPIPGASVTLSPTLSGTVLSGTTLTGVADGLNIAVTAQTRLLMVYGTSSSTTIVGTASGSINIL